MNTPSNAPNSKQITRKPAPNFVTLGIGILLLFFSTSYFLNGKNLLNKLLAAQNITDHWVPFAANLVLALLAISIVFTANFRRYISYQFSNSVIIIKISAKTLNLFVAVVKWTLFIAICMLAIQQINAGRVSNGTVLLVLGLFIIGIVINCITVTVRIKLTAGYHDYSNRSIWVDADLEKQQVLYIKGKNNEWVRNFDNVVNFSYQQGYVYDTTLLTRVLDSQNLLKNTSGTVKYNLTLNPLIDNFPAKFSQAQIVQLNTTFSNNTNLLPFVSVVLKEEIYAFSELIDDVLVCLDKFSRISDTDLIQSDALTMQNDIDLLSAKRSLVTQKAMACTQLLQKGIAKLLGQENMFDATFNIEDLAQFDEKFNKAKAHRDIRLKELRELDFEGKRIDMTTKSGILLNPQLGAERVNYLNANPIGPNQFKESSSTSGRQKFIDSKFQLTEADVIQITTDLHATLSKDNNWERAASFLSKSSNVFKEQKIPPLKFVEILKIKYEESKVERGMDMLLALVRDTLLEFEQNQS